MKTPFFIAFLLLAFAGVAQNKPDDIVGVWRSPQGDAHVQIFQNQGLYYGKIIWGTGGAETDVNNPNASLRSRKLIGLVMLEHFKFDGAYHWKNGTIYDPRNGETYSCEMWLSDGNNLNIRGFVGMSLFGRTEKWTRVIA